MNANNEILQKLWPPVFQPAANRLLGNIFPTPVCPAFILHGNEANVILQLLY